MLIQYGKQSIDEADVKAVTDVLQSDFLTQGPVVPIFENLFAEYCSVDRAVAVSSATAALHLACLALGLKQGDWVWTTPNTFVASANCALYCGANIDFVDIDIHDFNICVQALEEKLNSAEKTGTIPKILIVVHFAGQSCDMQAIKKLSRKYGFKIIEDASHAVGGKYNGQPVGSCKYSDITVFSFHPVKIITTGEGGVATTNDQLLADSMSRLRSHGITRDVTEMTNIPDGPWYYEQVELGMNYRMTDISAALGISQMSKVDGFVARRREIASQYSEAFKDIPISEQRAFHLSESSFHLYVIRLNLVKFSLPKNEIFTILMNKGIATNVHYIPVHTQPFFKKMGFKPEYCPNSIKYYSEAITLPVFPDLECAEQKQVIEAMKGLKRSNI